MTDIWEDFDRENITPEQSKQILHWVQEAEFRATFFRVYGTPLPVEDVLEWENTPKSRIKQKIFLEIAGQIEDALAIKQAVLMGNHSVAAILAAEYDEGEYVAKVIAASLKLVNASKPKSPEGQ